jgi:hypothetical protein
MKNTKKKYIKPKVKTFGSLLDITHVATVKGGAANDGGVKPVSKASGPGA